MKDLIDTTFGGNVRVRACGVLFKEDAILLVRHKGIGEKGCFWAPPGGGVEFGESIHSALKREFQEECNIKIEVGDFLFINEFIQPPLHAIELFYKVTFVEGELKLGTDPELSVNFITDLRFLTKNELEEITNSSIHPVVSKLIE